MGKRCAISDVAEGGRPFARSEPERRNPLTDGEPTEALLSSFEQAKAGSRISVMIQTGSDPASCAGGRIKLVTVPRGRAKLPRDVQCGADCGPRPPPVFYNLDAAATAAADGPAFGAGCDLTGVCDSRSASGSAKPGEDFSSL